MEKINVKRRTTGSLDCGSLLPLSFGQPAARKPQQAAAEKAPADCGSSIRFSKTVITLLSIALLFLEQTESRANEENRSWLFDFGEKETAPGYSPVGPTTGYAAEKGYGWVAGDGLSAGSLGAPDELRSDFLTGAKPAVFRVDVPKGLYRISLLLGDSRAGDHGLEAALSAGEKVELPQITSGPAGRNLTLTGWIEVEEDFAEIHLVSSAGRWMVCGLKIEPSSRLEEPMILEEQIWIPFLPDWTNLPDPIAPLRATFLKRLPRLDSPAPSGKSGEDYLRLIAGNVDFFQGFQTERGAIIDPYEQEELQYSTPAFALAAAALVSHADRHDLLEPAARAMDWATLTLRHGTAHERHNDFYPPLLAHAWRLLNDRVKPERAAAWRERLTGYDPQRTYRFGQGGGNWNVVALSGEALFHQLGLRDSLAYAEASLLRQGARMTPHGMYLDVNSEAMAYDHFPRLWLADMLGNGYDGDGAESLRIFLERGAWTSLFIQSPAGELPTGGRSAHHQWNEAAQCVTFEVFAGLADREGDAIATGVFKRAARRSLAAMERWQRPSGELWVVKNRVDPVERHGYENYSFHSQYNLLPMAMLVIAYEHARPTEDVPEQMTPAEVGGFVVDLGSGFHKIFANAGGMHVQIDSGGMTSYDPTGLVRIHSRAQNPQLGPSDGLIAKGSGVTAAVGVAWQNQAGQWHRLAEHGKDRIYSADLTVLKQDPDEVVFKIEYEGDFSGIEAVRETYRVTPDAVELQSTVEGYSGPLRMIVPLLASDGQRETRIHQDGTRAAVALEGDTQQFAFPGATKVKIPEKRFPNRNGWMRLAVAEFPPGEKGKIRIQPLP